MAAELACAAIQLHDEGAGQLLQKLQPKLMGPANVAGLLSDAAGAGGGVGEGARGDEEEEEQEKEEREEEEEEDLGGGMRAREENNDGTQGTYRGEGEAALAVVKTLRTYEALRRHYVRVNELHLAAKAKLAALNRRRAGGGKGGKGKGGIGRGRGVEVGRGKKVGGKWRVAARAGVGSGKRGEKQGDEEEPEEDNVERVAELLEEVMEKNLYNKRPDLSAGKTMRMQGLVINNEKARVIGHVPGVPVGFQFFSRQEMAVVGVNLQAQGGIDYSPSGANQWGVEVASCVVLSGGYEDDEDNGQWFDYTGQGGNNYRGDRSQLKDQQLERGNLALANSEKLKLPVRVIRGVKEPASYTKMVYTYDGLYRVVRSEHIPGDSGHMIFKFRMEREEGQPALQTPTVEFVRASLKTGTKSKDRRGVVAEDISHGKESRPVCAVNTADKHPVPPPAFQYIRSMNHAEALRKLARREAAQAATAGGGGGGGGGDAAAAAAAAAAAIDLQPPVLGCCCTDGCVDTTACECAQLNGGMLPFTREGGLIEAQQIVYECGPQCACSCKAGFGNASSSSGGSSACINRVSQKGVQVRLEVFKTEKKGWGVRSWDAIPAGHFVCEYTGDLMRDDDAETLRGNDEYLFDLDLARGIQERWGDVSGILGGSREGGGVGGGGAASAAAGGGAAGGLDDEEEEGEEGMEGGVRRESTRERKARMVEDRREEREEGREVDRDRRGRLGGGRGGGGDDSGGGGYVGDEGDYGKRARGHDSSRHHRGSDTSHETHVSTRHHRGSDASHETHVSTRHHRGSDEPHGSTRHHRGSKLPHESTTQHGRHGGSESGERSRDTRSPAAAAAPPAAPAAPAAAAASAPAAARHDDLHFCLDAKRMGNVARFINHSCNPNLFVQCVFYDHHDHRLPHIMLFAYDNIPPLKELTYDYGYQVDSVTDGNGNVKKLLCYCGAAGCRKRLY
ncbi:unnamed protein product [Closterium sp. NIES-54]